MLHVLRREDDFVGGDAPVDGEVGVVPDDGAFALGAVEVVALVLEDGDGAQHAEAVGKAAGNEELTVVLCSELYAKVLAVGGRAGTKVDGDIEDGAFYDAHQLGLGMLAFLEMQTAHHAVLRARLVVLYEANGAYLLVELPLVVRLEEVASVVGKDARLYHVQPFYFCFDDIHSIRIIRG